MLNLALMIEDNARKIPDREAIVLGPSRITYGQLNAMACQVANGLKALGVGRGDKVALCCGNTPYFTIVYFGALKAGATVVPLNPLLSAPEFAYHLKDSDAKVFCCFEGTPELPVGKHGLAGFTEAGTCERFVLMTVDPAAPPPDGHTTLGMLMAKQPPTFATADTDPDDTAVILYTSGTTGRPKGAELTHSNMVMNTFVSRDLYRPALREKNTCIVALPLFHVFGMTVVQNAALLEGQTLVMVPRFDPAAVLDLIVGEQVNFFSGVPTMFWALMNTAQAQKRDTAPIAATLRLCISGGAALPVELLRDFEKTFGVAILEGYGLSETSPAICFNALGFERKAGSIGQPLLATEMRVVNDDDQDAPTGERGEIVVRGHSVMKGYYKRPEATTEAMRNGWFHTGDIAYIDSDGYYFIVDRKKDMIIRGGYNVYPRELEETMMTHPDVSMVAVFGVPHPALGQEVKAYVILKPSATVSAEELTAWCKERMAAYKYPRTIVFRETLPMTATGKILKRELQDEEQTS